ncbi:glycine-rich domain-containing protein [Gottfriedia sp. NPDC057991]|uniref:glycine-rich domain-containing protein n=1 Tax=Gottfriedia sp. NPDC057991 TaxID=3346298 RepID=UPI0036DAE2F9
MKKFFGRFFKKNLKNDNAFYNNLYNQFNQNDLMVNSNLANLSLVSRLENAWKMGFLADVKERVMEKEGWSNAKYTFIEKELKRFFLMAAIFENVPMYSQEVDKIWHEMILFTKSYQNFCQSFCGEMIHHEPNIHKDDLTITDVADARAVYNLFYKTLFETTSVNTYILGNLNVYYKNTKVLEYLSSKTIQTISFVSRINSQTKNKVLEEFARIQKNLVEIENEEKRTKALKNTTKLPKHQSPKSYPSSANRSSSSKKSDDSHFNSTFLATNSFFALNESSNDCSSKSDSQHHNSHSSCSSSSHSSCSSSSHSSCSSSSCSSSGCSS